MVFNAGSQFHAATAPFLFSLDYAGAEAPPILLPLVLLILLRITKNSQLHQELMSPRRISSRIGFSPLQYISILGGILGQALRSLIGTCINLTKVTTMPT